MPKPRPRKPRFKRVSPPPPIRLTDRDFLLLDLILRHRFLRSDHLTSLAPGSRQHIIRRLGRLFHAGFVDRPRHQLRLPDRDGPMVYCLAERGRKELKAHGNTVFPSVPRMRTTASALRLGHDLRVSDVLVAIHTACARSGHSFEHHHEWSSGADGATEGILHPLSWGIRLKQDLEHRKIQVIPDAGFSLGSGDQAQAYFVLEVDRGTMPATRSDPAQTSFGRKVRAYRETRNAGVLWKRWNVPGFRVLVVTETRQRMASLQRVTAECFRYGRSTMFLFAVADELLRSPNPLNGPWRNCMGDPAVLIAQQDTPQAPSQSPPSGNV